MCCHPKSPKKYGEKLLDVRRRIPNNYITLLMNPSMSRVLMKINDSPEIPKLLKKCILLKWKGSMDY